MILWCLHALGDSTLAANSAPFHPVPKSPTSALAITTMKNWLSTCKEKHTACSSPAYYFVPSRLIDISSDIDPRIVLRSEVPVQQGYVALSYCWGPQQQQLITRNKTLAQYQSRLPVEQLPKTISDAILVTKILGFRYLWIDCFCIVQDNEQDWIDESREMENVYGHAELVLAATRASAATEGFLGTRTSFIEGAVHKFNGTSDVIHASYRIREKHRKFEPLDSRGWSFQEHVLARRRLSFGTEELQWQCKENTSSETKEHTLLSHGQAVLLDSMINDPEKRNIGAWIQNILKPYLSRKLTKTSDNLVALSAVASRFSSVFGDTYLAGLWRQDLAQQLTWYSTDASSSHPASQFAPSWSWASVSGSLSLYLDNYDGSDQEGLIEAIEASTTSATSNKFGPVTDGKIKILGKIFTEVMLDSLSYSATIKVDDFKAPYYLDVPVVASIPLQEEAGAIPYARRVTSDEFKKWNDTKENKLGIWPKQSSRAWILPVILSKSIYHYNCTALILGLSSTAPGCFERLGICEFQRLPVEWERFMAKCVEQVIVLV